MCREAASARDRLCVMHVLRLAPNTLLRHGRSWPRPPRGTLQNATSAAPSKARAFPPPSDSCRAFRALRPSPALRAHGGGPFAPARGGGAAARRRCAAAQRARAARDRRQCAARAAWAVLQPRGVPIRAPRRRVDHAGRDRLRWALQPVARSARGHQHLHAHLVRPPRHPRRSNASGRTAAKKRLRRRRSAAPDARAQGGGRRPVPHPARAHRAAAPHVRALACFANISPGGGLV